MDIYEEMTDRLSTQADQSSDWWDELSPAEQDELRKSVEESEDDRQLISHNDARKILTKWRK